MKTGAIKVEKRTYKAQLDLVNTYRFFSRGALSDGMQCTNTEGFESGGRWFTKSTEETVLEIMLTTVRGTVDTATGEAVFVNGIRANFKDLVIRDSVEGMLVWEDKEPACENTVSEIFKGNGTLHRRTGHPDLAGSIVMIRHNSTNQFAGLALETVTTICGVRCFSTQIRGLVVCPYREGDEPIPRTSFKEYFSPEQADLQTQLGYLHVTTNMATADRFAKVQSELCMVDRKTLYNKLQAIAGAQNNYALLDLYGTGYHISQAGAVVYVTRCSPVDVPRQDFANCTQEIPVLYQNTTWFVDAFTRIITPFPTVVPCSDLMPCLLYTSPSPRDKRQSRMPSSA